MTEQKKYQIQTYKSYHKIKTINCELRDYQVNIAFEALYNLSAYKICYLAMSPRTGKTLTAIAAASLYTSKDIQEEVLFITKKKAISSIESDKNKILSNFNLTITNYESLHKVERKKYVLIIVDEGHSVGAFPKPSERHNNIKMLMQDDTALLLLSGTPSPESYSQLYHQFNLSKWSPLNHFRSFYQFAKEYVEVKEKSVNNNMKINDYSHCKWDKLEPLLEKYFIRYNQKAAGFNAEIDEQIIKVDMKPITYKIANALRKDKVYNGTNDTILADTKVKELNKLHQIYSGTCILESGKSVIIDDSKARFIYDNFNHHKIAIFYKFTAEGEMLKRIFTDWTDSPEEFNRTNKKFIGQCQSVKEGVNLSTAEYLINLNLEFSSVTYQQLRERSSHKDRETPPQVIFICASNGIEEDIYNTVQKKQDYTLSHYTKNKIFKNDREQIPSLFD